MEISKLTAIGSCPDCAEKFHLGTYPKLSQKAICPKCRANWTVFSLNPLKLSWDVDVLQIPIQLW